MTQQITISKARQYIGSSMKYMMNDELAVWTNKDENDGYGYNKAKLQIANEFSFRSAKMVKSNSRYTLILDGEVSEVEYAWYMNDDEEITLEPTHFHEEE